MKKAGVNLLSTLMAILLLVSTVSWKVEKHYCLGALVDIAFFNEVADCATDMKVSSNEEATDFGSPSCCSSEVVLLSNRENLPSSWSDVDFDTQKALFVYSYSLASLFTSEVDNIASHLTYLSPFIVSDIQLLEQVFLI